MYKKVKHSLRRLADVDSGCEAKHLLSCQFRCMYGNMWVDTRGRKV